MGHPQVPEVPRLPVRPPVAEDYDVSQRQDVAKLRKHAVGLGGVLFLTVTGSAPISAMLFNVPIMVGYGQGEGAPAAFIFATIVLVVFSVGYVAMARKKTTAGGFYSYISHGLGRELGIGTGYGSVVAYSVFEAALAGGFAYFLSLKLNQFGVNIAWPWLALGMVLIIAILTYFDVRIGEESRDPKRIVPRALFMSVIGLGIFYTVTSWASLGGYPTTHAAIAASQANAAEYFLTPAAHYAGQWVASVMSYLIITGSFACGMAFHNTTARYMYSLGREGLAPKALGRTHPKWKSPHIASVTQSVTAAIIIGLFAIFTGSDNPNSQAYLQLYGLMAVMGVIIILSVQAVVSLSVLVYYERFHRDEVHWWKTRLAPLLSFFSQAFVVYLLFTNITFLGSGYNYAVWLGPIDAVVVIVGVGAAFYFKRHKPAKYETAGRLINEGL
jgi:amino acid transporter